MPREPTRYDDMTRWELVHEFCSRTPDLYMDMLVLAKDIDNGGLRRIIMGMDLDDKEGRRGRLRRPPWTPE